MRKKRLMGARFEICGLMKDVLEGRMEGKRPSGRKKIMMMDGIKDDRSYCRTKRSRCRAMEIEEHHERPDLGRTLDDDECIIPF